MNAIRNIIFDFDGTLSNSREDIAAAQLWALAQVGFSGASREDLFPHIGKPLAETFQSVLPGELHERIPEAIRLYSEHYPPRSLLTTAPFDGVRETLEALVAGGCRLAVASTKRGAGIRRATDHFGITRHFLQLQGSDELPFKPDPAILLKILLEQSWSPAETLMVGDTPHDIQAGRNAGIATCGVTYGSLRESEMLALRPDYCIRSFPELLEVVQSGTASAHYLGHPGETRHAQPR
jgi:HAD superfamily hydrolase (TIGR01509 family)